MKRCQCKILSDKTEVRQIKHTECIKTSKDHFLVQSSKTWTDFTFFCNLQALLLFMHFLYALYDVITIYNATILQPASTIFSFLRSSSPKKRFLLIFALSIGISWHKLILVYTFCPSWTTHTLYVYNFEVTYLNLRKTPIRTFWSILLAFLEKNNKNKKN